MGSDMTFNLRRDLKVRRLNVAAFLLATSIVLLTGYWRCEPMRSTVRWLFWSRSYKAGDSVPLRSRAAIPSARQ